MTSSPVPLLRPWTTTILLSASMDFDTPGSRTGGKINLFLWLACFTQPNVLKVHPSCKAWEPLSFSRLNNTLLYARTTLWVSTIRWQTLGSLLPFGYREPWHREHGVQTPVRVPGFGTFACMSQNEVTGSCGNSRLIFWWSSKTFPTMAATFYTSKSHVKGSNFSTSSLTLIFFFKE